MKIETLRTLIEDTIKNDNLMAVMTEDTIALQKKIMKVIDLYEEDNKQSSWGEYLSKIDSKIRFRV
jgi:hypothetical protein